MPVTARAVRVAVGLTAAELDESVSSFFERFDWEGARFNLDTMSAEQFFERF